MVHQRTDDAASLPTATAPPTTAPRQIAVERLAEAMEACRDYLLLVADRWLGDDLVAKAGASDVVQETFLEAQRDLARFRGGTEAELRSWLRRILLNNLSNLARQYRSEGRDVKREVSLDVAAPPDGDDSSQPARTALVSTSLTPYHHAIRREQLELLAAALRDLSERDRRLIVWHHQEHRSFKEIGELLHISADTARVAWARAIQRLQKLAASSHDASTRIETDPEAPPHDRAAR